MNRDSLARDSPRGIEFRFCGTAYISVPAIVRNLTASERDRTSQLTLRWLSIWYKVAPLEGSHCSSIINFLWITLWITESQMRGTTRLIGLTTSRPLPTHIIRGYRVRPAWGPFRGQRPLKWCTWNCRRRTGTQWIDSRVVMHRLRYFQARYVGAWRGSIHSRAWSHRYGRHRTVW